ncbi:cytochrome b561 [Pseudorhodobacter antarcticus]|uniref:Cytochrome b561 n=2 Tax=Pseudorhodobacter antarcticus TaxID=1077947 RepID=A0A1H8H544_9RHOB|nr:cytochrome b561 [Pseudorhodobacter antarcticus]
MKCILQQAGQPMKNTGYSTTARLFHWGMAALILVTIPVGLLMVQSGIGRSLQNALFLYHKNVGVLLLGLIMARLVWRVLNPAPPLPAGLPAWQAKLSRVTHGLLYALLLVVPLSGYIRVRAGGFPIESLDAFGVPSLVQKSEQLAALAKSVHYYSGMMIAALLVLHIGAALYHRFAKQDGVFARMWPPFGGKKGA